jgi:hypothetical protein
VGIEAVTSSSGTIVLFLFKVVLFIAAIALIAWLSQYFSLAPKLIQVVVWVSIIVVMLGIFVNLFLAVDKVCVQNQLYQGNFFTAGDLKMQSDEIPVPVQSMSQRVEPQVSYSNYGTILATQSQLPEAERNHVNSGVGETDYVMMFPLLDDRTGIGLFGWFSTPDVLSWLGTTEAGIKTWNAWIFGGQRTTDGYSSTFYVVKNSKDAAIVLSGENGDVQYNAGSCYLLGHIPKGMDKLATVSLDASKSGDVATVEVEMIKSGATTFSNADLSAPNLSGCAETSPDELFIEGVGGTGGYVFAQYVKLSNGNSTEFGDLSSVATDRQNRFAELQVAGNEFITSTNEMSMGPLQFGCDASGHNVTAKPFGMDILNLKGLMIFLVLGGVLMLLKFMNVI